LKGVFFLVFVSAVHRENSTSCERLLTTGQCVLAALQEPNKIKNDIKPKEMRGKNKKKKKIQKNGNRTKCGIFSQQQQQK
jgi:hypothetical protein